MDENISAVVVLEEGGGGIDLVCESGSKDSYEDNGMIHFNSYRLIKLSIIKQMRTKTIDQSKMLSPLQLMR